MDGNARFVGALQISQFLKKLAGRAFDFDIHIRTKFAARHHGRKASIHAGFGRMRIFSCVYAGKTRLAMETLRGERLSR